MKQIVLPFKAERQPTYRVLPHEGRFKVIKPVAGTKDLFDVVEDCRTQRFAEEIASMMNERISARA